MDEFKALFVQAVGCLDGGDTEGQMAALYAGREVVLRMVGAMRAVPTYANLPPEQVYHYIGNVAQRELVGPQGKADRVKLYELEVRLPAGRPPTSRPKAREKLIAEVRARRGMPDYLIADRARRLGAWTFEPANACSQRRRIRRIREAAAE